MVTLLGVVSAIAKRIILIILYSLAMVHFYLTNQFILDDQFHEYVLD